MIIISSAILQIKQAFSRNMFKFTVFLTPLFNVILLGMMYQKRSIEDFILHAILGSGISAFWTTVCFSSAADISREKQMGTLPILFVSPAGFNKIMLGKIFGNIFWGVISFLLNIFYSRMLFGYSMKTSNNGILLIFIFLGILTFISISLLLCGLFTLSRAAQVIINIAEYPIIMLTGMIFPVSIFPKIIRLISYSLSPTWIMRGFSLAVYGGSSKDIYIALLMATILTIIYFLIAIVSFNKIETSVKKIASLEVY